MVKTAGKIRDSSIFDVYILSSMGIDDRFGVGRRWRGWGVDIYNKICV